MHIYIHTHIHTYTHTYIHAYGSTANVLTKKLTSYSKIVLESRSSASQEIPEFNGPNLKYRVHTSLPLVPKLRLIYFITSHPLFL
jgi:hypothetical protein